MPPNLDGTVQGGVFLSSQGTLLFQVDRFSFNETGSSSKGTKVIFIMTLCRLVQTLINTAGPLSGTQGGTLPKNSPQLQNEFPGLGPQSWGQPLSPPLVEKRSQFRLCS